MAISDRISAMYDHVGDIYDTLELGGDTTTDKNIVNINTEIKREYKDFLANGTDTLWNNWEKVTGTGETLFLTPTIKGKMKVDLKGNTYQYTTTGKNKLPTNISSTSSPSHVTAIRNDDGTYTLSGTSTATGFIELYSGADFTIPAGTYIGSTNVKYYIYVRLNNGEYQELSNTSADHETFTFSEDKTFNRVYLYVNASGITYSGTIKPMIRLSSTSDTFEPYTGNQPSPNPDYPQDIQVVSGDNTIKVEGKNLFNGIFRQGSRNGTIGATSTSRLFCDSNYWIEQGETYTFSTDLNTSTFKYAINISDVPFPIPANVTLDYDSMWKTTSSFTFTASVSGHLGVPISKSNGTDTISLSDIDGVHFQLEKGTQATTYTPYVSQTYPISLGNIELCKIGTYQDKIAKSTGKNLFKSESWRTTYSTNGYPKAGTGFSTITSSDNNNISFTASNNYGGVESDFIKVKANETYTLSFESTSKPNRMFVTQYDNNKTRISTLNYLSVSTIDTTTFTTTQEGYIAIGFNNTTTGSFVINEIELDKGSTALPYEPYGKVWYLNKQIGKVVLDGSENWQVNGTGTSNYFYYYYSGITTGASNLYCNYYTYAAIGATNTDIGIFLPTNYIRIRNTTEDTIENFKTWLSTHNTIVYYVLATPTYEEITGELLSQLEALAYSYDEQTNISQVNDDMPFVLDITALKEMS